MQNPPLSSARPGHEYSHFSALETKGQEECRRLVERRAQWEGWTTCWLRLGGGSVSASLPGLELKITFEMCTPPLPLPLLPSRHRSDLWGRHGEQLDESWRRSSLMTEKDLFVL